MMLSGEKKRRRKKIWHSRQREFGSLSPEIDQRPDRLRTIRESEGKKPRDERQNKMTSGGA